ncbi:helicase C-terminal domain-containing protein [Companilactobacillus sp. DQM5]|uniref:helicase C-terminal domain-containing protein n=1 Tax=Companilactobacillus sp. DQM5 TaxID=3463359 RepID=UPI00405887E0
MDISKKYAVVDLETTGTNKNEDKIIQFGCTLIDDGKITDSISILINPHQVISQRIEELTGISNRIVKNAPDFKQVAERIYENLKGRTFVAHNVNFDFPFIKDALIKAGYPELNVPAIDTVELSQILLPQLSSFKLQDISEYLNIEHDHPHRADDDSNVTAKLLLILIQRIYILPMQTLKSICDIGKSTIRQTGELFLDIYNKRKNEQNILSEYMYQKNGIVLRKKDITISSNVKKNNIYPLTDDDKRKSISGTLEFRNEQAKMMDDIYKVLDTEKKWSIIEAPTGMGKTLGYLYPLSFKISDTKKLVIATTTTLLQSQILDEAIPILNQLNNFSYTAQIIKSSYNYIDLDRFYNTLYQDINGHKVTSILKMKILVWLTMTTTGDMDELRLSNKKNPYLNLIAHRGEKKEDTIFSEDDFWKYSLKRAQNSEILITNQSYFSRNINSKIWGSEPILVIDEAHHFAENLRSNNSPNLNIQNLANEIKKISDTLYQNRVNLRNKFDNNYFIDWGKNNLQEMEEFFQQFDKISDQLDEYIYINYFKDKKKTSHSDNFLNIQLLSDDIKNIDNLILLITNLKDLLTNIIVKIDSLVRAYFSENNFSGIKIASIISNLSLYNNNLRNSTISLLELITKLTEKENVFGISFNLNDANNKSNGVIHWYKLNIENELKTINNKFKNIYLISGAINSNDDFEFFLNDLQLSNKYINQKNIYNNQFNVEEKTKIYIPNDSKDIRDMTDEEYNVYLSDMIQKFLLNNTHQALVLFNSLSTMSSVYNLLNETELSNQKEILAQGINGTNEKIKKRFSHSKNSILLGSNSFWEGVDFPQKILEIVIVTRLPFDSPDQNETMIRSKYLSNLDINAFGADALPRATLKLRQGFGRLLRTQNDRGIMVILDDRIIKSKYGKQMLNNFPEEIIIKNLNSEEIKQNLEDFLY